jgi:hypothetical protein
VRAVFGRTGDERGRESCSPDSLQVSVVRCGQHDFARIQAEEGGGSAVGIRARLVRAADARAEDHVPQEPGCFGHVQEQRSCRSIAADDARLADHLDRAGRRLVAATAAVLLDRARAARRVASAIPSM